MKNGCFTSNHHSGQIITIPKPELSGCWFPYFSPPFGEEKSAGTVRDGNLPRSFITEKVLNHRNCFHENKIAESKHSSFCRRPKNPGKSLFFSSSLFHCTGNQGRLWKKASDIIFSNKKKTCLAYIGCFPTGVCGKKRRHFFLSTNQSKIEGTQTKPPTPNHQFCLSWSTPLDQHGTCPHGGLEDHFPF